MTTATQALSGRYAADVVHSTFGFRVRYSGLTDYRGTLDDVSARLDAAGDRPRLEGSARAESISIQNPPQFRAHVLGPEFFDVEQHPEVSFRSTSVDLDDAGDARMAGELEIRGVTRSVEATGSWSNTDAAVALQLETTFDRRDFGIDWQMQLPGGADALAYDVTLDVNLVLKREDD